MSHFHEFLKEETLVTSIIMGLVALVGLVGNGLMIRALIQYRELRTVFYTVFGFLSVVDSVFLVIAVPASIIDMLSTSEVPAAWCRGSFYITSACGFVAAYLLVVLAVLRGILLTNRNIVRRPRTLHLLVVCIGICVITSLCSIPVMEMFTNYGTMCDFVGSDQPHELNRATWLISSLSTIVPLFLIIIFYIMTYVVGKRYFADSYSPREKEKSRLVTCIIIAFTVCQAPYRITAIYELYTDRSPSQFERFFIIKNYLMCLLMADKAVRPILYTKLDSSLCEVFDEVINCVYCSKRYSMTTRFRRPIAMYISPSTTPVTGTTIISSTDSRIARTTERTISSSSSTSATSQTPLTRKEDKTDLNIEVLLEQND